MISLISINTFHNYYPFVEGLLHSAFPKEERRDTIQQREYTDNNDKFSCYLIKDNNLPIGLLTCWDFEEFIYIEHFAIDPSLRNNGYGQKAITALKEKEVRPIILEAEEPTNELTKRRIGFYERQGFILQSYAYEQPPYRSNDGWLPMRLMTYGTINLEKAKETIYKEVYGQ